ECPYRLRIRMTSQDDLMTTIAVNDVGDISFALQHSSLAQLRDVSVATQICYINSVSKTFIGSVIQQILCLIHIGEELLLGAALECCTSLDAPMQKLIRVNSRTLSSVCCCKAMISSSCED